MREKGWDSTIVERDPEMRTEGYVIDFFGSGWDVAERMRLVSKLRKITYPIDSLRNVDANGTPYVSLPVERVRDALDAKYTYLRRSDLERILFDRANTAGVPIRFATTITSLEDYGEAVKVVFSDGSRESFGLVFGADGVHSRVRELTFGPESLFDRYLGCYVAAFHLDHHSYNIGTSLTIYEEPGRSLWTYSLGQETLSAMYIFKHEKLGYAPPQERVPILKKAYRGARWISGSLLNDVADAEPVFFDSTTQIVMPAWSKGRVALLGDACACLTLLAGQGSHLAMAEAYVLATELDRYGDLDVTRWHALGVIFKGSNSTSTRWEGSGVACRSMWVEGKSKYQQFVGVLSAKPRRNQKKDPQAFSQTDSLLHVTSLLQLAKSATELMKNARTKASNFTYT